jgi:hypothetical protein
MEPNIMLLPLKRLFEGVFSNLSGVLFDDVGREGEIRSAPADWTLQKDVVVMQLLHNQPDVFTAFRAGQIQFVSAVGHTTNPLKSSPKVSAQHGAAKWVLRKVM